MAITTAIDTNRISFKFSERFKNTFDNMMESYNIALDTLNELMKDKTKCEYGVCNCKYKMRYITPKNISTFADNFTNAILTDLLPKNIADISMFSVESVKRFLDENDCIPFEQSSMLDNQTTFINPKNYTLNDLLVLFENDIVDSNMYSAYEIGKRVECVKTDVNTINDMHFVANIKNIVNALPNIINSNKEIQFNEMFMELYERTIETFILFAISLNTLTITSIINYCNPSTYYGRYDKETKETLTVETVDTSKKKPIFLVLSEGKRPIISSGIRTVTHSHFTHLSISFNPDMKEMFSYGGPIHDLGPYENDKYGFRREDLTSAQYEDIYVSIYAMFIDNSDYTKLLKKAKEYIDKDTKFDSRIFVNKILHLDHKPDENEYNQVCSTFVDSLLKLADIDLTDKNIPAPADFAKSLNQYQTSIFKLYYGLGKRFSEKQMISELNKLASKKKSLAIDDVITECCLLKTNDFMIRNKIPFNCNIRDVVLQDVTPTFKDTRSAIYFMTHDSRSPIAVLLRKYINIDNCGRDFSNAELISKMFIKQNHCSNNNINYKRECGKSYIGDLYDLNDFHTDVNWLDKIAYGNNYLDGNYRLDTMGNNASHPITTTLDLIYSMYSGCSLKTNEDIASNIMKVSNTILAIIDMYPNENMQNYDLVKDILTTLGEILTRDMLKLYYNNTRVYMFTDDMVDTSIPGYSYVESFIMEDGNNGGKPKVSFNDNNKLQNAKMMIGKIIRAFMNWIRGTLSTIFSKFNENHKIEVEWVKKHDDMNKQIAEAMNNGTFIPNVTNFPLYKLTVNNLIINDPDSIINGYLNKDNSSNPPGQTTESFNQSIQDDSIIQEADNNAPNQITIEVFKKLLPKELGDKITSVNPKDKENLTMISNFILYSKLNPQDNEKFYSGSMKGHGNYWEDLIENITGIGVALEKVTKENSTRLEKCLKELNSRNDKNDSNVKAVLDGVQAVANVFLTVQLNILNNQFYKNSYTIYRDIVAGYKQQSGTNQNNDQGGKQ